MKTWEKDAKNGKLLPADSALTVVDVGRAEAPLRREESFGGPVGQRCPLGRPDQAPLPLHHLGWACKAGHREAGWGREKVGDLKGGSLVH